MQWAQQQQRVQGSWTGREDIGRCHRHSSESKSSGTGRHVARIPGGEGGAGEGLEIRLKTSHSPKMRAFRLKMVMHPTGDELAETCTWTASQRRSICGRRREDPLPGAAVPATGTMQSRDQKEGAPQNAYPAKPPSGMQGMVCEPRAKSV